jgi:citronellol/citronellal dehydrogenase
MCEARAYDPPAMALPGSVVFADGVLDGRVALVTGGGTGLGKAAARELAACGASVVIAGRREDVLAAAGSEIGASFVAGDVREAADAERMVGACLERHGRLDVLVNNAGGQYFVPAEAIEPKRWQAAGSTSSRRRRSSLRAGRRSRG